MAILKGTNSYATVDEADAYFADRLAASVWTAADMTQKAQALVTATRILDDIAWSGCAVSESQPLAFPRISEYFDPKVGTVVYLDGTAVPSRITGAAFELALHLLANEDILESTGSVKGLQVGPIQLSELESPELIPDVVRRMIKPLKQGGARLGWWRAN